MPEEARTGPGWVAIAAGVLVPVAYGPSFTAPSWTPKAAVLLLVTGVGAGLLVAVLRDSTSRPPAIAALGFLAWAIVATLASSNPTMALFGPAGSGTGLAFVVALVAAWALGASTTERDRPGLVVALLTGAILNAVLALAQARFDLTTLGLGLFDGRSGGFMGNPVHLAALLTGALGLAASGLRGAPRHAALPIVLIAGALQASGSRIALAITGLVVGVLAVRWRDRSAALLVVLVVAGLAAGSAAGQVRDVETGSSRLGTGVNDGSTKARLYTWADAGQAIASRPLTGAGPGRYLTATTPYRNIGLARVGDGEGYFRDAHNLFVEYGVTTGLPGVAALILFLILAARLARGPLAWFATGVLVVGLVQPLFVGTTPLAFLALGAAGPTIVGRRRLPWGAAVPVVTGAALAAVLLVADSSVKTARLDGDPDAVLRAARRLPAWPETASISGRLFIVDARVGERDDRFLEALRSYREAVRRDPEDPRWLNDLGAVELAGGDPGAASRAFRRALARAPYSRGALLGLARAAHAGGDDIEAEKWLARAERVAPGSADVSQVRSELR